VSVCLAEVGLVTSLSASFTRWRANNDKQRGVHNDSFMSNQSLMSATSAVSDVLPSTLLSSDDGILQNNDCKSRLCLEVAATPKMIRKRKAENDTQPFSTTKKLVVHAAITATAKSE